ncbi:tetratricopeptide repeat protein 27-like [Mizuhopecten yessoensis]|uniref:Tetratricopeptide repeat protein 27 n=1 Tax=Mizuhopecten yessoensis TaxID=6573 RepID=A0A210PJ92_MIZYE|nr:tetratricopeptide repeat protein 27-like [Mizuhopecten yessoensis]OWF36544.1 Tetratricopeptide repeat protein 27 [Mizuhopecten yessoensis]
MSSTETQMRCLELDILRDQKKPDEDQQCRELFKYILDGKHESALSHSIAERILKRNKGVKNCIETIIKENVDNFFNDFAEENRFSSELELLCVAISCLQLFVQGNWTGPPLQSVPSDYLPEIFSSPEQFKKLHNYVLEELSMDGEPVYDKCLRIELLFVARFILLDCREHLKNLQTADWWLLRCISVLQQVLDDRSPTLKETTLELIDRVSKLEPLLTDDKSRDLATQFRLEAGYCTMYYYEYNMAHEHFMAAKKNAGLDIELTGAMGKRTRFQQDAKAQLVLKVKKDSLQASPCGEELIPSPENIILPKDLLLGDETVLEAIKFEDDEHFADTISPVDQAVVVGVMEDYRRSRASYERLTEEELEAYTSCVLAQVKCWSTSVHCLVLRSTLQKGSCRRVERSMMQVEEIVNQINRPEPPAQHRLHLFYCHRVQSSWMIKMDLADLLLSIGAVGSALDAYEQLQMWEQVIACYKRLGKMEKAEDVIREQLAIKETASLLCYLGDVTRDITHYEKAWELSNHKSARAMRCLAYHYFAHEDYEKSLECFDKSLKINCLQVPVWFTCGCTALSAQKYEKAVHAFKMCVNIDYDNYEAWNNMATAYVQLKEREKALTVLMEATKYSYENWKLWENVLIVATDCGDVANAILAYNRLLDIKVKWDDGEVLSTLVQAVTENYTDADGLPGSKHIPELLTLFGRTTSKVSNNAEIWKAYAKLTAYSMGGKEEKHEVVLQYLQKAYRCVTQDPKWEQTTDRCKEIADQALELAERYEECCSKAESSTKAIQMLSSAKLMVKGVLTKIKKQHTDEVTEVLDTAVVEHCSKLEVKLQEIISKVTELKGS